MSLQPVSIYTVPEQTSGVARAAFPQSSLGLRLYDRLGTIFEDQDFADLFPKSGQPGQAPFRLALVTVLQFLEGLSDRNAMRDLNRLERVVETLRAALNVLAAV